jgi:predicted dehydrogenase
VDEGHSVIDAQKKTGRIMQVGSQRVSSVIYQKAKDLLKAGAIGEFNMVEAWWDRNSAVGAWQYSIPLDAGLATCDWDRFQGRAKHVAWDANRFFRWRNYQDYGTGVAGDLFVHLFSGMHFITGAIGPSRVYASGGLRYWKDGRDVPDLLLGICDYDAREGVHPAFNLTLRVNFEAGAGEAYGVRFIGSEGVMTIGNNVTVSKHPPAAEPGYSVETLSKDMQEKYLSEYRKKYPKQTANADAMRPDLEEKFLPPAGYNDHRDHHRVFIEAVRNRKPVVEDPTFGLRAAGPALLSNVSYFERRVVKWDPVGMAAS